MAIRDGAGVFLDDLTPADLAASLGAPVGPRASPTPRRLLARAPRPVGGREPTSATMLRPIIAIVGRPNVGKSTLFNRLIGRRRSLVRDVPGVTRDRLYGTVVFERWQATVVDTGGFDPGSESDLVQGVRRQVLQAVDEADLLVFVVDGRAGITGLDQEIAGILRKSGRPALLAVNKVDTAGQDTPVGDALRLGFEPVLPCPPSTDAAWPSCSRPAGIARPRRPRA